MPASVVSFFGTVIALILWLSFYASSFEAYQNLAVIAVIFLTFVAVMGATWSSWGTKWAARHGGSKA